MTETSFTDPQMTGPTDRNITPTHYTQHRAWTIGCIMLASLWLSLAACGDDTTGNGDDSEPADVGTDTDMSDADQPDSTVEPDGGTPDTGPPENFEVSGFGLLSTRPASCQNPGEAQRLRFFFQNRRLEPLAPGDYINGREVQSNQLVNAGVLDSERMRVATRQRCTSPNQCSGNLKCGSSGLATARRYCLQQSGMSFEPGTVRFDYNPGRKESDKQLIGIVWENTGSWTGNLPNPVAIQYDEEGQQDYDAVEARASDPNYLFRDTYTQLGTYIPATTDPANTKVGGWTYGGTSRVGGVSVLENNTPDAVDHFTNTLSAPETWLNEKNDLQAIAPANTYQAMLAAMDDFDLDKYSDHEKFMIVVTDGPNEVKDSDSTFQDVLSTAKQMNIHVMIMHLDARIDSSLLRDLPYYYDGDQNGYPPTCSSSDECLNFETCRTATIYADEESGDVMQTNGKYCMPDYEDGRLGPINQYSRLACETEGHYIYLTDPGQFSYYSRLLPYAFDGQWSIEADVSALSEQQGLDGHFFNLSGVIKGLLGSSGISTLTAKGFNFTSPPVDTRMLLKRGNPSDGSGN